MIHTVYSNSYEVLRVCLMNNIEALGVSAGGSGGASLFERAFEKVPVITPNNAVEEDLRRAVADRDGICAGIDFMKLSSWMGFFSKEPMANIVGNEADWMIWDLLRRTGPGSFREGPGRERLRHYLEGRSDEDVWHLARRIAEVFVVYSTYRLDWVLDWLGMHPDMLNDTIERTQEQEVLERHPDFAWQRDLWRELASRPSWRGRRFLEGFPDMLRRLAASGGSKRVKLENDFTVTLPDALHVFVPFVVPPVMLPIIKAYAASGRDVWFYLLNPTSEYWYDLLPRRLFDWKNAPEGAELDGHPLLADNGGSTRANIDRIWRFTAAPDTAAGLSELGVSEELEEDAVSRLPQGTRMFLSPNFLKGYAGRHQGIRADMAVANHSYYIERNSTDLLSRVQDSILNLDADLTKTGEGAPLFREDDRSIRFMRSPTPTRELEALADWLHAQFAADPGLGPDDVLVVTPDISTAAPLIANVFDSLPPERRIEWRISGLSGFEADKAAQAVLGLVELVTGRATLESFEAWIALPHVAKRFGFTSETVPMLGTWLRAAGYRYGLSDAHLRNLDPVTHANVRDMTLSRAVERLVMGFALPASEGDPLFDTLPVRGTEEDGWKDVSEEPGLLDAVSRLAASLEGFRLRTEKAAAPEAWTTWLADATAVFFRDDEGGAFNRIRNAAATLREEIERAGVTEIPFGIFMKSLELAQETSPGGGMPTPRVTFTGMSQLRPLPYKIIAVVGLNEDCAFPGNPHRQEFDLMAHAARRGDRDSRRDNRNVFLDILLAARRTLLISYVCGTGAGSAERQPSVVAQELREWLLTFAPGRAERRRAEALLTVTVPLNAYSTESFRDAGRGWRSHDPALFEALRKAVSAGYAATEPKFADTGLEVFRRTEVSVREICDFWKAPARKTLAAAGVRLPDEAGDDERGMMPPDDGLSSWMRRNEALEAAASGDCANWLRRTACDPRFGAEGIRDWLSGDAAAYAARVEELRAEAAVGRELPEEDLEIDLGEGFPRVTMRLRGVYESGDVRRFVRATVSKGTGNPVTLAFTEFIAACALERVDEGAIIAGWTKDLGSGVKEPKDDTNPEKLVTIAFKAYSADEARRILRALLRPCLAAADSAAQGVDTFGDYGEEDESADLILWRGGDLDRMRRVAKARREVRFDLFKKKLLKKTQDEKVVAAFEEKVDEALKAMAQPTQDDQQDD